MRRYLMLLFIPMILVGCSKKNEEFAFNIIQTNNMYGNYSEDMGNEVIGLAKIASYVKEQKIPGLLINSDKYIDIDAVELLNKATYSVMNVGSLIYNENLSTLLQAQNSSKFSMTSSNLIYSFGDGNIFSPYVTVESKGVKIAVFGMLQPEHNKDQGEHNLEEIAIGDPYNTTAEMIKLIDKYDNDTDLIFILSELGNDKSFKAHEILANFGKRISLIIDTNNNPKKGYTKIGNSYLIETDSTSNNVNHILLSYNKETKDLNVTSKVLGYQELMSYTPDKEIELALK